MNNRNSAYRFLAIIIGFTIVLSITLIQHNSSVNIINAKYSELNFGNEYSFKIVTIIKKDPNVRYSPNYVKVINDDGRHLILSAYPLSNRDSTLVLVLRSGSRINKKFNSDSLEVRNGNNSLWFELFKNK
jgi:hypothetical protein